MSQRTQQSTTAEAALEAANAEEFGRPAQGWRLRLYKIIFESDTEAGRRFDKVLIVAILLSVAVVLVDSVDAISTRYGAVLNALEWFFTVLFTTEYLARLACVRYPARYARSFFGIVDLASVLPTYFAFFFPAAHALIDVRILRLLRVFRIFKLSAYIGEYRLLGAAIVASRRKILVFLSVVVMIVLIAGTLMYIIEGPEHGFTTIPTAVYWAIVTMTTVGYGDLTPHTPLGRALAALMMLVGWGILAVPTGIVTSEMTAQRLGIRMPKRNCSACGCDGHDADAGYCRQCGARLPPPSDE